VSVPFLLSQNRKLSLRELERAVEVLKQVLALEEDRPRFIAAHDQDPEFCLPGGNYAGEDIFHGPAGFFRRSGRDFLADPQRLQRFRFYTMIFTGYSLSAVALTGSADDSLLNRPTAEFDEQLPALLTGSDYRLYWRNAATQIPAGQLFVPPAICGEVGWYEAGVIVNHDTLAYQERGTLLHRLGIFQFLEDRIAERGFARVLEIGGGFGALARHIKQVCPNVAYTICDLPEAFYFSATYLTLTLPAFQSRFITSADASVDALDAIHFIPNYSLPNALAGRQFDLVINTLSMSEMSEYQIGRYGEIISAVIGGGGMFFEQNHDNRPLGMTDCKEHLPRYFLRRTAVRPDPFVLTQGQVDIWSNRQVVIPYRATTRTPPP
jgi:hypothetical protein